jgi:hypothetical protein
MCVALDGVNLSRVSGKGRPRFLVRPLLTPDPAIVRKSFVSALCLSDELPLALDLARALVLHVVTPVVAVLR